MKKIKWYLVIGIFGLVIGWTGARFLATLREKPVFLSPSKVRIVGSVSPYSKVSISAKIVNRTPYDLRLKRVIPSFCSCLIGRKRLPREIASYSSAPVYLELSAPPGGGSFRYSISFLLESLNGRSYCPRLILRGKVRKELVKAEPVELDFGVIQIGRNIVKEVILKRLDHKPLLVEKISVNFLERRKGFPDEFTIKVLKEESLFSRRLIIDFHPEKHPGLREGVIEIKTRGGECGIGFIALVKGAISATPEVLNFGFVNPGDTKAEDFEVTNKSGKPLSLRLVRKPSFAQLKKIEGGPSPKFRARLVVGEDVEPHTVLQGKIVFETGIPIQPTLEVPVVAAVK